MRAYHNAPDRRSKEMSKEWSKEDVDSFREIMEKFNEARARWLQKYGNDDGFNEWFNHQLGITPTQPGITS